MSNTAKTADKRIAARIPPELYARLVKALRRRTDYPVNVSRVIKRGLELALDEIEKRK